MEAAVEGYAAQGLSVTAEGWGPWAVAGMAAQQPALLARLQQQGKPSFCTGKGRHTFVL